LAFADFGGAAPEEAAKSYLGGAVGEGSSTQNVISYHYIYDAQGNTLSDGENNYTYDALNRIAQVTTKAGDIQRNHYDAEGLRHQMEENGELISFLYSDREAILEEDTAGNRVRYIRGHELLASDCAAARTYYHYASDEMGSITHIVDEEGKLQNRYEYDAFGNMVVQEETIKNRFGFTGEIRDALTRQYYLRARFYNPVVARFLNEDTYYGDGLNLYAYCHNNPVGYIDPSGHICEDKYAAIESIRKEHGLTAEQALNKYKELRNSGMSAQEIRKTIENSGRNGSGAGEGGNSSVYNWSNDDIQTATDKIHTAQSGDTWYGNKNPIAVTVSADGRVIVSKNNGVPGPKARAKAIEIFGSAVEFVRGGEKSDYKKTIRGGNHAEARGIQYMIDHNIDTTNAKQAISHYSCADCMRKQEKHQIINITGTADKHNGKITRKKKG
jgi:RHS repeat-associated protein